MHKNFTSDNLDKYFEENPTHARAVMEKALMAARGREAAKKARELTRKRLYECWNTSWKTC